MKLASNRASAANHRPVRPIVQHAQGGSTHCGRVLSFAVTVFTATVLLTAPGMAQQTIVIGGDKPGTKNGDAVQRETPGVVVNDDVLNSLGAPGTYAPALPPTSPNGTSVGQEPLVAPGTAGTAYRLPDTGQLVVSRPSTLLFPPQTFPQSHLTVPPPAGSMARTTLAPEFNAAPSGTGQSGTGQSRLLIPKPVEPVAPQVAQPTAPAVPRVPVTPAPTASTAPAASPPSTEPAPMAVAKPVEEPAPPPVATIAPAPEPMAPATPPAVATLPPEPAAEPPAPPSMVKDLQSATPPAVSSPAPEPAPSAPTAEQTPAPAPAPSQSAALPPAGAPISDIRVVFDDESAELTAAAKGLLNGMAKELLNNADARVQLLAYAKGSEDGTSRARRLSLSRALAVRAFLIEKGVRSTRMDVRALGSGFKDGPPDRVDVLPQESTQ